jgi:hypothetical protein
MKDEDRKALIQQFEEIGVMTFRLVDDRENFDTIMEYVRKHAIPTYTDIDKTAGTITVSVRPLGTLEAI